MNTKKDELIIENEPTRLGGFIVVLLCATALLATVAYGLVDSWGLAFLSLCVAVIVIFWTIDSFKRREFLINTNRLFFPLLGLILIGLIQLLPFFNANLPADLLPISSVSSISSDPFATRVFVAYLTLYLVFFAAALTFIDSTKRITKVAVTIIIFGTIMAFFAIIQRLANLEGLYGVRVLNQAEGFGSFVNQHHFAALMEMTVSLAVGILLSKTLKKEQTLLLIFSAALMSIAVFFTGSRGGMLSFFGIGVFFLLTFFLRKNKNQNQSKLPIIATILVVICVIIGSTFFLGADSSMVRSVGLSEMTQKDFSSGRLDFWKIAIQIFLNNPILGAGFDSFAIVMSKFDTWNGTFRIEQAHNDYLQVLAEAGLLGLLCVVTFIFITFKQGFKNIKANENQLTSGVALGALAGCLGIFIHSFFDFPLRTPSNTLIFLILVTLATVSFSVRKPNSSS